MAGSGIAIHLVTTQEAEDKMQVLTIKAGAVFAGPLIHRLKKLLPTRNQFFSIRLRVQLWEGESEDQDIFRSDGSKIERKTNSLTPGISGRLLGASDLSLRFKRIKWYGLQSFNNLDLEDSDEVWWSWDGEKISLTRQSRRDGNILSKSSLGAIYPSRSGEWKGWSEEFSVTILRPRGGSEVTFLVIQHEYFGSTKTGLEITEDRQVAFESFETSHPVSNLQSTFSSWFSLDRKTGGPYQIRPITAIVFKNA